MPFKRDVKNLALSNLRIPKDKILTAFWINFWYRIFGDKRPDSLAVLRQLEAIPAEGYAQAVFSDRVYCQSFSAELKRSRDDFVMGIPLKIAKNAEKTATDGIVSISTIAHIICRKIKSIVEYFVIVPNLFFAVQARCIYIICSRGQCGCAL